MEKEVKRQVIHAIAGLVLLAVLFLYGRDVLIYLSFGLLVIGSILINLHTFKKKNKIYELLYNELERPNAPFAGWAPAWYLIGVILIATFLKDPNQIAASIWILAIGDSTSTIIGRKGTHKLPYNKKKTVEGTVSFILFSLVSFIFVGKIAIPISIAAALAESLPIKIDDNVLIPIVLIVLFGMA
jgi:dolichol kinase